MKIRDIVTSRWLLIPLSLLLGATIGAAATFLLSWQYFRDFVDRDWANKAMLTADIAATIDDGQAPKARDSARNELAIAADTLANNGADGPEFAAYWHSIATYSSISPGIQFSPTTQALLARFPSLSPSELEASHCVGGICMLARHHQPTTTPLQ